MSTLHDAFKDFEEWVAVQGDIKEEELTHEFMKLAEHLIFGGHIIVDGRFLIYIRTVEFYFHQEDGPIKDPIVYHRNGRVPGFLEKNIDVPYFPLMSIHGHSSGYDITFESKDNKYRASALIRKYSVYDTENKVFIVENDDRSTFLYYFLNGFSMDENGSNINYWKDEELPGNHILKEPKPRRNVKRFIGEERQKEADPRPWSFSAKDALAINR